MKGQEYTHLETFMVNILWFTQTHELRFDMLLTALVFLTWMRLIFYFKVSHTFGPMFKIIQEMIKDLTLFLTIWSSIILMFSCVSILAFG